MTTELRVQNQSQQLYVRALSQAWRNGTQLHDPSIWLTRDPEAEEKMLRDADIAHAVGFRRHLIAGRQWTLIPRNDASPNADMAVSIGTELLSSVKHFTTARLGLARAFFSGARFARIHGQAKTLKIGDGKPRTWWVPTRLEDMDKRMYRIVPDHDGDELTAHWERWDIAVQDWKPETMTDAMRTIRHVYQDDQATLGHGRALREALGWWWYAKEHVFQESLQAVERFAQGILSAKVDGARDAATGLPNSELIESWTSVLEDLRSRHVLVFDAADQVEMINMNSSGWELLHTIRDELRSTIFTLVLGANLTTSANEGGSYALAEIQENSTEALVQFDRETLEETLTDDLLGCLWFENYANLVDLGIAQEKPRFSITQEKRQDPQERASVAQILNSMGVELSLEDLLEQTGFRKPESGEDLVEGGFPVSGGVADMPGGVGGGLPIGSFGNFQRDGGPAADPFREYLNSDRWGLFHGGPQGHQHPPKEDEKKGDDKEPEEEEDEPRKKASPDAPTGTSDYMDEIIGRVRHDPFLGPVLKVGEGDDEDVNNYVKLSMRPGYDYRSDAGEGAKEEYRASHPDDISLSGMSVLGPQRKGTGTAALKILFEMADRHNVRIAGDPVNTLVNDRRVPQKKLEEFYRKNNFKPYREHRREGETIEQLKERIGPPSSHGWMYVPENFRPTPPRSNFGALFHGGPQGHQHPPKEDEKKGRPKKAKAPTALDKWGDELVDLDGVPIPTNEDGTITLYHRTTEESAQKILDEGAFSPEGHDPRATPPTFFSNVLEDGGAEHYGGSAVAIKIDPAKVEIYDTLHGGEIHVRVDPPELEGIEITGFRALFHGGPQGHQHPPKEDEKKGDDSEKKEKEPEEKGSPAAKGPKEPWQMTSADFRVAKNSDYELRNLAERAARGAIISEDEGPTTLPEVIQAYGEDFGYENPRLVEKFRDVGPEDEVTLYRAVSADDSNPIGSGDWVAIEKSYADLHGSHGYGETGSKILSIKTKAKNIVWAGTSADEYFYSPVSERVPSAKSGHEVLVTRAIAAGEAVSPEVLAEYPHLKSSALFHGGPQGHQHPPKDRKKKGKEPKKEEEPEKKEPKKKLQPASVNVEAKPNMDKDLLERWEKLEPDEKKRATDHVLGKVVPEVMDELGIEGELVDQRGGWMGDNEDSVAVMLRDPSRAVEAADLLGAGLHQEGMYLMSMEAGPGLTAGKGIQIALPKGFTKADIDNLYTNSLWPIKGSGGQDAVIGYSAQGGYMTIGIDEKAAGITARELTDRLEAGILDDRFGVRELSMFTALRTQKDHYGETATGRPGGGQPASAGRDRIRSASRRAYEEAFQIATERRATSGPYQIRGRPLSRRGGSTAPPRSFSALADKATEARADLALFHGGPAGHQHPPKDRRKGPRDKKPLTDEEAVERDKARVAAYNEKIAAKEKEREAGREATIEERKSSEEERQKEFYEDNHIEQTPETKKELDALPEEATQQMTKEQMLDQAPQSQKEFQETLNKKNGLDKILGGTSVDMTGFPKMTPEQQGEFRSNMEKVLTKPGPVTIIGPQKDLEAAARKVETKYGGDYSGLKDLNRGTIAVDHSSQIGSAFEAYRDKARANGWEVASQPDDRWGTPMSSGYRDYSFNMKNTETGQVTEMQMNTKSMVVAKEFGRADHPDPQFRGVSGHSMYKEQQGFEARMQRGVKLDKREQTRLLAVRRGQRQLYDLAAEGNRAR